MGDIYARADEVLACIGPADESSDYIRQKLPVLDQIVQDFPENWYDYSVEQARAYWNPPSGEDAIIRLADHWDVFCERPYFRRLWVIQELYEGRDRVKVLCGTASLSWDRLVDLQWALSQCFNVFDGAPTGRDLCSEAVGNLDVLFYEHDEEHFDLAKFTESVCAFDCEDPRDRIYGTLRLIDWDRVGIPRPVPNYDISNFDLGLQVMNHFRDRDFAQIRWLAIALDINYTIQGAILAEGRSCGHTDQARSGEPLVSYSTTLYGATVVERDANGCLSASLVASRWKPRETEKLLENSVPAREGEGPHRIFAYGKLAALAGPDVHPGDIIVELPELGVWILRPEDDLTFRLTGRAVLLEKYSTRSQRDWICSCWAAQERTCYDTKFVKLIFEASAQDALTYASHCIEDDMESCIRRLNSDFPRLGCLLRDVSATEWEPHQSIRPVEASCPEHEGKTCADLRRNGLRFCVASGCGTYVQVAR